MKKIYIAGFDVFYDDAVKRGKEMKKICSDNGFEGLYPLDNECDNAEEIFHANINLIKQADIIAANMNSFRGHEPDSGTVFEIGYAYALGKKIYCYLDDNRNLVDKIGKKDKDGISVENFNLPLNLMIAVPADIVKGNFRNCIEYIKNKQEE